MSEGGKTARSDLWGGAAWAGFGLLIMVASWRMERFESMGAALYAMPGFVPGMLGGLLLLLGCATALRGWHRHRQDRGAEAQAAPLFNRRVGVMLVLVLAYAVGLIGRLPFWLATAVFVAAFVAVYTPAEQPRRRRVVVALLAGALTSVVVTFVFQRIFLVHLP